MKMSLTTINSHFVSSSRMRMVSLMSECWLMRMLLAMENSILILLSRRSAPFTRSSLGVISVPCSMAFVHRKVGIFAGYGFTVRSVKSPIPRCSRMLLALPPLEPPGMPTLPVRQHSMLMPFAACSPFLWRWAPRPAAMQAGLVVA